MHANTYKLVLRLGWAQVRYCTALMRNLSSEDECGCTGELEAASQVELGFQSLRWGDSVCLREEDVVPRDAYGSEVRVRFVYTETNTSPESLRAVFAGFRNQVRRSSGRGECRCAGLVTMSERVQ